LMFSTSRIPHTFNFITKKTPVPTGEFILISYLGR
jgi:hypothetical protein